MNVYMVVLFAIIVPILGIQVRYQAKEDGINQRIIGGQEAYAGQFPYMAAIYKSTSDGTFFCSGALINNQWILTSAYCVDEAVLFSIDLGALNLKANEPNRQRFATDIHVAHPDYNPTTLENDIGLIQLRMPIGFTTYIRPVDLLPSTEVTPNMDGIMTMGWGQINDETAGIVDELRYVNLVPLSNEECRLSFGNQIVDSMVCVGGNYNEGFCRGDTGAPLIWYKNGRYSTHVGVASFISNNGCETPEPSGYTRTFSYIDWINNVTAAV
jgi:secreted trypsin-like serine protease